MGVPTHSPLPFHVSGAVQGMASPQSAPGASMASTGQPAPLPMQHFAASQPWADSWQIVDEGLELIRGAGIILAVSDSSTSHTPPEALHGSLSARAVCTHLCVGQQKHLRRGLRRGQQAAHTSLRVRVARPLWLSGLVRGQPPPITIKDLRNGP